MILVFDTAPRKGEAKIVLMPSCTDCHCTKLNIPTPTPPAQGISVSPVINNPTNHISHLSLMLLRRHIPLHKDITPASSSLVFLLFRQKQKQNTAPYSSLIPLDSLDAHVLNRVSFVLSVIMSS